MLTENKDLIWTPATTAVKELLLSYFYETMDGVVTSVMRTPSSQLEIMKRQIEKRGWGLQFPDFPKWVVTDMSGGTYCWQLAWSKLLVSGFIINPCFDATMLLPYIGSDGINRKGKLYKQSPHVKGLALDISGKDINGIKELIEYAIKENEEVRKRITQVLLERNNNAVHIGVKLV